MLKELLSTPFDERARNILLTSYEKFVPICIVVIDSLKGKRLVYRNQICTYAELIRYSNLLESSDYNGQNACFIMLRYIKW